MYNKIMKYNLKKYLKKNTTFFMFSISTTLAILGIYFSYQALLLVQSQNKSIYFNNLLDQSDKISAMEVKLIKNLDIYKKLYKNIFYNLKKNQNNYNPEAEFEILKKIEIEIINNIKRINLRYEYLLALKSSNIITQESVNGIIFEYSHFNTRADMIKDTINNGYGNLKKVYYNKSTLDTKLLFKIQTLLIPKQKLLNVIFIRAINKDELIQFQNGLNKELEKEHIKKFNIDYNKINYNNY